MDERRLENVTEMGQRAQRRAGDIAGRAGAYVQEQVEAADARLERMTGQSVEALSRDARRWIENHPLQAVAITVGLGFLLGKLLTRDS